MTFNDIFFPLLCLFPLLRPPFSPKGWTQSVWENESFCLDLPADQHLLCKRYVKVEGVFFLISSQLGAIDFWVNITPEQRRGQSEGLGKASFPPMKREYLEGPQFYTKWQNLPADICKTGLMIIHQTKSIIVFPLCGTQPCPFLA